MTDFSKGLEEFKQLELIILNYSDKFYRIRNWLIVIISGLVVAHYSGKIGLDAQSFQTIAYALIGLFYFLEIVQRVVQKRAMTRLELVERMLREELEYDGPRITESLKGAEEPWVLIRGIFKELPNALVWMPYLVIGIIVTVIFMVSIP